LHFEKERKGMAEFFGRTACIRSIKREFISDFHTSSPGNTISNTEYTSTILLDEISIFSSFLHLSQKRKKTGKILI
jgi:hypothetical protein